MAVVCVAPLDRPGRRRVDLMRQRRRPFAPGEQLGLMQGDDKREGLSLPGLAKVRLIAASRVLDGVIRAHPAAPSR
jgi:hypothetical protein